MKELGMYIHIPFCARKCYYCDFISFDNKEDKIVEYVQAVREEIIQKSQEVKKDTITTIYIGGGTPSFINSTHIVSILSTIQQYYQVKKEAEITIEVNPGTVTQGKLEQYRQSGINRISIGLQTTQDILLKQIGRIHTYEEFLKTYQLAREVGFKNINVDLMLGLPNQTILMLEESLNQVIELQPEHISVYSLILEENTPLYAQYQKKKIELPEEETERQMYWEIKNKLEAKGYVHYEISNFAKQEKESKHNSDCWKQKEYLGIGVAAHSYRNNVRYSNLSDIEQYIQNVQKNEWANNKQIEEEQTIEEKQKEFMLLGLRTIKGIRISEFKNIFIQNPIYLFRKELDKLVQKELIEVHIDTIRLTKKGLDFANLVWEEFI